MKKVFSLLAVLAVTVFMASSVWAANTVLTSKTSVADFSTAGEVSFDIALKFISDDSVATTIDWNIAAIPLNKETTTWTTSTVYGVIESTVTKNNGAIYMYQNNKAAGTYQATTGRDNGKGKTVYSGLVHTTLKGDTARGYIPLVYNITKTKGAPTFGTNPESVDGTRYFSDQSDEDFDSNMNYVTIANLGGLVGGVDAQQACWNIGSPTGYIYFGGLFSNVIGGDVYGTSTIQFVSHVE